ncbi:MAG: hypothetical protein U0Y10_05805 [Spirosomataceae bacterium]
MKRLFLLLVLGLVACNQPQDTTTTTTYFDLKAFVEQQIAQLSAQQPMVDKTVEVKAQQEHLKTKDIDWAKELDLFVQADLNKPAYISSYESSTKANEVVYTLKLGEDLPVKSLKIMTDAASQLPIRVEATLRTENYLFTSEKQIQLQTRILPNGKPQLTHYQVQGYQQLIFGSKQPFQIEGKIL